MPYQDEKTPVTTPKPEIPPESMSADERSCEILRRLRAEGRVTITVAKQQEEIEALKSYCAGLKLEWREIRDDLRATKHELRDLLREVKEAASELNRLNGRILNAEGAMSSLISPDEIRKSFAALEGQIGKIVATCAANHPSVDPPGW